MRRLRAVLLAAAAALAAAGPSPAAGALPAAVDGEALPTLAPMLERTSPAVVNIATEGRVRIRDNPLLNDPFFRRFFDLPAMPRERRTQSLGSGVIVDAEQGYVLTNHHVIDKAERISVTLRDGRRFDAELVGEDPDSDVAVIRIPPEDLTAVPLADSDALRVGDFVVAIGNPFGLGQTVTSGIVSALGRSGLGIEGYEDFIQTDASINPGNSGGALVNLRGELVGINTAIIAPGGGNVGIGFAIPVNMCRDIMEQLVEHGEVRRGVLGVTVQDLTPELARAFGLERGRGTVIAAVAPDSPAARAGLAAGDVLLAVDGRPVSNAAAVRNRIGLHRINETVSLRVLRDGEPRTVAVTVAAPEVAELTGERVHPRLAGARFEDVVADIQGTGAGVKVAEVNAGSPAWRTGLRPGDVIASVNRRPVADVAAFARAVRGEGRLLLNIHRGDAALFVLIR